MIRLVPRNPLMFTLELDDSLWRGLSEAASLKGKTTLGKTASDHLKSWAIGSPNPQGQRAALARAVADLITVAGELTVERQTEPPPTFWDLAGS